VKRTAIIISIRLGYCLFLHFTAYFMLS